MGTAGRQQETENLLFPRLIVLGRVDAAILAFAFAALALADFQPEDSRAFPIILAFAALAGGILLNAALRLLQDRRSKSAADGIDRRLDEFDRIEEEDPDRRD